MKAAVPPSVGELRTRDSASFEHAISTMIAPLKFVSSTELFYGKFRWVQQHRVHVGRATNGEVRANSLGERPSEPARFVFCLQVAGSGTVEQGGRRAEIGAGQVSLYRSDAPYELTFPAPGERVGIALPAAELGVSAGRLDRLTGTRLNADDPLLSTVAHSIIEYERALHAVAPRQRRHVLDLIVGALRATVASMPDPERADPRDELFRRATTYIEDRLGDSELSPQRVAEALFVSTRSLQQAFVASGAGVAGLIRERRLERAAQDLGDPEQAHVSIGDIALRWGFASASHFAELVRRRFGVSPSALRPGSTTG
ncbi:MAG: helix-turn-helix domain-containing protein [Leucobacter sp.]